MSGYRPYIVPVETREEWVKTATLEQLSAAMEWTYEAKREAEAEYQIFVSAANQLPWRDKEGSQS